MPLFEGIGGVLTGSETDPGPNIHVAIGGGYNFIEVHLNRKADIQGGRMAGVLVVDTYEDGVDNNGVPKYSFNVRGGYIDFVYDPSKYIRVADPPLLDDTEPCMTGPKGYNRDFLASHWDSGIFIIPDKEIEADIKRRAVLLKKQAEEKKFVAPENPAELSTALKDLEIHEKFLKEKKESLLKAQQSKTPSYEKAKEELIEKEREKEKKERKAQQEIEAKKKAELMKKAREKAENKAAEEKKKKEVDAKHSHETTD
jgi:hypothetical protein